MTILSATPLRQLSLVSVFLYKMHMNLFYIYWYTSSLQSIHAFQMSVISLEINIVWCDINKFYMILQNAILPFKVFRRKFLSTDHCRIPISTWHYWVDWEIWKKRDQTRSILVSSVSGTLRYLFSTTWSLMVGNSAIHPWNLHRVEL